MSSFEIVEIKSSLGDEITSPSILFSDDDGRISKKTGIDTIHRSSLTAYELALNASRKLLNLKELKKEIEYLIYVTQSPTYFLPNHASIIQDDLEISKDAMCFDINQGCSGFVQALILMTKLLEDKSGFGLIVCSDTYSHHLSRDDRSTQVLFSDGASATLIKGEGDLELKDKLHLTDGSGADFLSKTIDSSNRLNMDGASVFQWTRRELGKQIQSLISKNNLSVEEIDSFYLHQASKLVLNNVIKSLSICESKVPSTLNITGNLVSSSIPFLLEKTFSTFSKSNKIIMSGFGVGLSSSSCLIEKIN